MSGPTEKDLQAPDALAAALEPTYSRDDHDPDQARPRNEDSSDTNIPLDEDYDPKDFERGGNGGGEKNGSGSGEGGSRRSSSAGGDNDDDGNGRTNRLVATKSFATDTSVATGREPLPHVPADRPWYKKMNPLRWGGVPPVPDEREVSGEYKASFFSKVTWSWMTPLMVVSPIFFFCVLVLLFIPHSRGD